LWHVHVTIITMEMQQCVWLSYMSHIKYYSYCIQQCCEKLI